MSRFAACVGCSLSPATCVTGRRLRDALAGLFVSHVKHRCAERKPIYEPGAAVLIRTRPYRTTPPTGYVPSEEREGEPPWCDFRGTFVRQVGSKAICFIQPGLTDDEGEWEFYTDGIGFLKVPLSRIKLLPDVPPFDLDECERCGEFYGLTKRCEQTGTWHAERCPAKRREPCVAPPEGK